MVKVPATVLEGIEEIRDSGQINMLDRVGVSEIAEQNGDDVTADWIRNNSKAYAEGIFQGFDPQD